jgi:hypothetical protein
VHWINPIENFAFILALCTGAPALDCLINVSARERGTNRGQESNDSNYRTLVSKPPISLITATIRALPLTQNSGPKPRVLSLLQSNAHPSPVKIQSTLFPDRSRNRSSTSTEGATKPRSILESCPCVIPSAGAKSSCRSLPRNSRTRRPMEGRSLTDLSNGLRLHQSPKYHSRTRPSITKHTPS